MVRGTQTAYVLYLALAVVVIWKNSATVICGALLDEWIAPPFLEEVLKGSLLIAATKAEFFDSVLVKLLHMDLGG